MSTLTRTRTRTKVTLRARAFSGEGIRTHTVVVEVNGSVTVWDSVAEHYTLCHTLCRSAQSRARKLARAISA